MLQLTCLIDNEPSKNKSLLHEHGLSFLLERGNTRILFDCGASDAAWQNGCRLGKNLSCLDAVILSHSHYDHASGFKELATRGSCSLLYTGPHFFEPKYSRNGICLTDLSAGFDKHFLDSHSIRHVVCDNILEIGPGLWLIGNFPRIYAWEDIPSRFVRLLLSQTEGDREPAFIADDFSDEICLAADIPQRGLILLAGCSHPGILNMAQHVHRQLSRPIYAIFGGTHLHNADEERIAATVTQLKEMGVQILGMNHCSGRQMEEIIQKDPDLKGCHMAAGDCLFLP